eukprot:s1756_g4.t8
MRQELLQTGVRSIKAGESYHAGARVELTEESDEEMLIARGLHSDEQAVQHVVSRVLQLQQPPTWEGEGIAVDCKKFPMFCTKKLNCSKDLLMSHELQTPASEDPLTESEKSAMETRIATSSGKANLRSWCRAYPMYSTSMQKCIVESDSRGYGREMFKSQQKLKLTSADAIYCFVSGHCNNTQVTEKTTMQEAEGICNKLYGQRWTELGWKDYMAVLARALEVATKHHIPKEWNFTGWGSLVKIARHEAGISAMTACAMGNFQCDVTYCQMNYCHNDRFRAKFGNFSWSAQAQKPILAVANSNKAALAAMEAAHTHDLPILPHSLIDPDPPRHQQAILPRDEAKSSDGTAVKASDRGQARVVDIEQEGLESVSATQLSTRFASHEAPQLQMRLHQGLVDLRASMVLKQIELLQMLDRQLEEAKQVDVNGSASISVKPQSESISFRSNFGTPVGPEELQTSSAKASAETTRQKPAAPKALRASTAPEETGRVAHRAASPRRRRKSFTEEDDEQSPKLLRSLKSSDEESVIFENIVPGAASASKTPRKSRTLASAALPSLGNKRRRMSWFTKQSERGSKMRNMQVTAKPEVARLSTAEKELAEKEGQQHSTGLFGKYHNEYSIAQVRKNFEDGLEWDRMDSLRAENRCLTIVRNPWFERLTLSVIFLNAVEMAINAEFSDYTVITEADPIFIVAEVLFCIFFTVELVIRYATYISTCQALKDAWFSFDFMLVVLMNFETWVFPLLSAAFVADLPSYAADHFTITIAMLSLLV